MRWALAYDALLAACLIAGWGWVLYHFIHKYW